MEYSKLNLQDIEKLCEMLDEADRAIDEIYISRASTAGDSSNYNPTTYTTEKIEFDPQPLSDEEMKILREYELPKLTQEQIDAISRLIEEAENDVEEKESVREWNIIRRPKSKRI